MSLNHHFPEHFSEFIRQLNKFDVEYLLIGGYAMGVYGHIRATNDLDIYINATEENAERVLKASISYGIPAEDVQLEMFIVPKMIGIGEPPLRIEILKKLDAIDFKFAFARAVRKKIGDLVINAISVEDLILLKEAAVRDRNTDRDREDLSFLKKLKNASGK